MSKINDITISNFKFFGEAQTLHLEGKHMLLYGENGSGKSSIFWGLYTLLEASLKTPSETGKYFLPIDKSDESLVNIYAPLMTEISSKKEHSNSYIKIQDDNAKTYELSLLDNRICGDSDAQESRKASDFINYQSIFKFQEFRNSETPDLYDVFVYSILPYVSFASFKIKGKVLANASSMWSEYLDGPGYTTNYKGDRILVYKNSPQYKEFCNFEAHFNSEFTKLKDYINVNAKARLEELGYNMDFQLVYSSPSHIKKDKNFEKTPFRIELSITKYNDKSVSIKKPHVFLNEAKLSALATAIRLTILDYRVNTITAPNALKVLVLDDLMISLDMSNREPLLDILIKEYSNKYQILFFTHDKSLYDFVYHKIEQHGQKLKWIWNEMYVGWSKKEKHEHPVIIDGVCEPIEKSKKYFDTKDYTASGLFLRQALEKLIGGLLPVELRTKADGGFVSLQVLWEKLIDFYSKNGLPISTSIKNLFGDSKLLVLNSSAHFQRLSNPIYKKELLKAFDLYEELAKLKKIEKELVIGRGAKIEFNYPPTNYKCSLELEQDLVIIEGDSLVSVMPRCKNITWEYNGIEFYDFDSGLQNLSHPLKTATPKLNKFVERLIKLPLGITEEVFMKNCLVDGTPLDDYLGGIKVSSLFLQSVKV